MLIVLWKTCLQDDLIKNYKVFRGFHHENEFRRNLRYICNNAILIKYSKRSIFAWDYYNQNPFLIFWKFYVSAQDSYLANQIGKVKR